MTTLLLTGATGSFGQAFVRKALDAGWYGRIIAFSDAESNQSRMKVDLPPSDRLEYFLGNVRDYDRLCWAMRAGVDVVVHAAAMKEVPTCEYDWPEAVATNVDGSRNVARAAIACHVPRALLISTDKAVAAVTEYGKTKAMAESWFVRSNRGHVPFKFRDSERNDASMQHARDRGHGTALAVVRYGNVLGSRASVVQDFRARLTDGRPLTVTNPSMTRFWWTLSQAVNFVEAVLNVMGPGDVWIPKLRSASVKALILALTDAPEFTIDVVGPRGTEKMHESLIAPDEARSTIDVGWAYVVRPADASWPTTEVKSERRMSVSDGFRCDSDDPRLQMTVKELRALLESA